MNEVLVVMMVRVVAHGIDCVSCAAKCVKIRSKVTLVNENACIIPCRFRVEGPFRILELSQVGRKAVVHPDLMGRTAKWPSGERHEEQVLALGSCHMCSVTP